MGAVATGAIALTTVATIHAEHEPGDHRRTVGNPFCNAGNERVRHRDPAGHDDGDEPVWTGRRIDANVGERRSARGLARSSDRPEDQIDLQGVLSAYAADTARRAQPRASHAQVRMTHSLPPNL